MALQRGTRIHITWRADVIDDTAQINIFRKQMSAAIIKIIHGFFTALSLYSTESTIPADTVGCIKLPFWPQAVNRLPAPNIAITQQSKYCTQQNFMNNPHRRYTL
jgi:hypothetical protein